MLRAVDSTERQLSDGCSPISPGPLDLLSATCRSAQEHREWKLLLLSGATENNRKRFCSLEKNCRNMNEINSVLSSNHLVIFKNNNFSQDSLSLSPPNLNQIFITGLDLLFVLKV